MSKTIGTLTKVLFVLGACVLLFVVPVWAQDKPENMLFEAKFDSLDEWEILGDSNNWVIEKNVLKQTSVNVSEKIFAGDPSWTDYHYHIVFTLTDTRSTEAWEGVKIIFRAVDDSNYIIAMFTQSGEWSVWSLTPEGYSSQPYAYAKHPEVFFFNRPIEVDIYVRGDSFEMKVNGKDFVAGQGLLFKNGRVGVHPDFAAVEISEFWVAKLDS